MEYTEPQIGGLYRHYKTKNLYKVIAIGKHTETLETLVIYEAQYDNPESKIWCRPIDMFIGTIEKDGEIIKRFTLEK